MKRKWQVTIRVPCAGSKVITVETTNDSPFPREILLEIEQRVKELKLNPKHIVDWEWSDEQ